MREYLFRGRRKDKGTWVDGNLSYYPYVNRSYISRGNYHLVNYHEIENDTVCQYTGQLDREGTKVFECDVMKFTDDDGNDSFYFVEWRENKFIVVSVENYNAIDELDRYFCDNAVVISNKFDWKPEV